MPRRRAKGEGSIFKQPDGLWVATYTLPDGTRRRKRARTQQAVKDWLLAQRQASRDGLLVENDQVTFGQFVTRYMEEVVKHKVAEKTFDSYAGIIRLHVLPVLGEVRLVKITPQLLQKIYADKLAQGLSRRTVHYIHAIIHMTLQQAIKWGMVPRNAADLVDKPTNKRKPVSVWSIQQVSAFLEAVKEHRWYPIYVLAIYCGMREGEILGLHREDVDLLNRTIQIRHQAQYLPGRGIIIKEPKSDAGKRSIVLPGFALGVLTDYILARKIDSGLLFTTSTGNLISCRNLLRHFRETSAALGLPIIRFHDLRHTHASLMLAAGVNPKVVQERLGHSQISLTLDTYSHVMPGLQQEAADKFDELLGG